MVRVRPKITRRGIVYWIDYRGGKYFVRDSREHPDLRMLFSFKKDRREAEELAKILSEFWGKPIFVALEKTRGGDVNGKEKSGG